MKSNDDKCHLIVVNNNEVCVNLGNETINGSTSVDLLGIKIDNNLNCNEHLSKLCKKGNQKLHALARVSKFLSKDELNFLMKTFITSPFHYCPLAWMFHNRTSNNKIQKLVYDNANYTFQELLKVDNSMTINHRNLQTEMYKAKKKFWYT